MKRSEKVQNRDGLVSNRETESERTVFSTSQSTYHDTEAHAHRGESYFPDGDWYLPQCKKLPGPLLGFSLSLRFG